MARLDLHRNLGGRGYILDIQAEIMRGLNSRVVIPVLPLDQAPPPAGRLNPRIRLKGIEHVLITQYMTAVPMADLGEVVASLADRETEIVGAVDLLITGV
jgi:toxin CcdB